MPDDGRLSVTVLEGDPDDTWGKLRHAAHLLDVVEDFMCNYLGDDEVDEDEFDADQKAAFDAMWKTFDELQRQMLKLRGLEKVKDERKLPDVLDPDDKTYGPDRLGRD